MFLKSLKRRLDIGRKSKMRTALAGLGAAAISSTGAEAELVEVATQSYTRLGDGSLQVTFQNGRSVIVPDGDWTVVDGRVFIEEAAISQAGTSASAAAATSGTGGFSLFGRTINPWVLAGGAVGLGYFIADSDSDSGSTSTTESIRSNGSTQAETISNKNGQSDDANEVVVSDLETLFQGATGSVTYAIAVTDSSGSPKSNLVYVNGTQLLVLEDPEVTDNGTYTVVVTATDAAGNSASGNVFITVDVEAEAGEASIQPSGQTISEVVSNETDATLDDANTVVIADLSPIFQDAEGAINYSIVVQDSAGNIVSDLFYVSGSQILILNDPEVPQNGIYTIAVTGTDTANNSAGANVFITVEVDSEAGVSSLDMATLTPIMNETATSGTAVIDDLSIYFEGAEGSFTYDAAVTADVGGVSQTFNNILRVSGNSLVLSNSVTDTFIEGLNNSLTDEDISFTVVITATDTSDGTQVMQSAFQLTLDATGVNDAPELTPGAANNYTISKDDMGTSLEASETIESLDLSVFVIDDDNGPSTGLTWAIQGSTDGSYGIANGTLTGTAGAADETLTISVTDNQSNTTPLEITVFIDIA